MCQCQDRKGQKILVIGRFSRIVYALKNLDCDNEKKKTGKKIGKRKNATHNTLAYMAVFVNNIHQI